MFCKDRTHRVNGVMPIKSRTCQSCQCLARARGVIHRELGFDDRVNDRMRLARLCLPVDFPVKLLDEQNPFLFIEL